MSTIKTSRRPTETLVPVSAHLSAPELYGSGAKPRFHTQMDLI
jgi:hypothetical protein